MSYTIKPEDVSEVMVSWAEDRVGLGTGAWDCVDVQELCAAILNAAIEAELVSPPCHVTRYLGELVCQGGTLDPALFIGKPKEKGDEHWKGQTE